MRYGKKPARPGAVKLKFESFFSPSQLPTPPLVFGRPNLVPEWGLFANDRVADCVFAGAAHETMLWNAAIGNPIPSFTDAAVLNAYSICTGYISSLPQTDQGADMQAVAEYRRKTGILDNDMRCHKVDSYVSIKAGDIEEIALAAYLFGAIGIGLEMPVSAMQQFDHAEPWTPVKGSPTDGGHYVSLVGRNSAGDFLVVTWGRLHAVSPDFLIDRNDEGICYLTPEFLNKSPRGFDGEALRAAMAQL